MEPSSYQDALETTSQEAWDHMQPLSLAMEDTRPIAILLPPPGNPFQLPASPSYPDPQALYSGLAEACQTIHRLVLRKRATSPYQIKLSHKTGRMRAARIPLSGPREVERQPAAGDSVGPQPDIPQGVVHPDGPVPSACSFQLLPWHTQDGPRAIVPSHPGARVGNDGGLEAAVGLARTLSTLDTWSEICEDLCRAMEVFTVLSEVAPKTEYAHDWPSSCASISGLHALPRSTVDVSCAMGSRSGRAGQAWNSFVFPCFVA
ncbi:hypothetical protein BC628DRAFT_1359605 [Trametes gibbosa]|nr:hypothetical protein BC628DRAFT_1359605 [Trametes gibbosa]